MDKNKIAISTYEKIAGIYTKQYFEDKSDIPFIDKFLTYLQPGAKILDIGCGPGQNSKYLSEKGFKVTGIDRSKEMLAIAKKKVPKADFKYMDMRNLEFEKEIFDGLLVAYSLIHIPDSEVVETLKGFNRILRPKGYILVITQKGEADQIISEPFKPSEKMFINFFTKEKLKKYLKEVGFETISQSEVNSGDALSLSDKVIYTITQKV